MAYLKKILVPVALAGRCPEARLSDDHAIGLACELRDKRGEGSVVAVGIGAAGEEGILAALARGADRAILVQTDHTYTQALGHFLRGVFRREKPGLIVVGASPPEIGPYLAGALNISQAVGATTIESGDGPQLTAVCESGGTRRKFRLPLPGLIVASDHLPSPPLLSLYAIVEARAKPVEQLRGGKFAGLPAQNVENLSIEPAERHRVGRMVSSVDELIDALRYEAHVI